MILVISMSINIEDEMSKRNKPKGYIESYEYGLPSYLQKDLDAYEEGLKTKSSLLDCLWGELYGSINVAEINDGVITHEHAEYLRNKYLR